MNFFLFERAFKLSERFPFSYYYPGYHVTTQLLLIKATAPPAGALRYFAEKGMSYSTYMVWFLGS